MKIPRDILRKPKELAKILSKEIPVAVIRLYKTRGPRRIWVRVAEPGLYAILILRYVELLNDFRPRFSKPLKATKRTLTKGNKTYTYHYIGIRLPSHIDGYLIVKIYKIN